MKPKKLRTGDRVRMKDGHWGPPSNAVGRVIKQWKADSDDLVSFQVDQTVFIGNRWDVVKLPR